MRILRIVSEAFKNKIDNNNFGEYNNNNGNFISVFECTIVNLATYRQFTIGCLRLNYSKKFKKRNKKNCIKSGLSQFLFLQQKMKYVDLMAIFIIF